MKSVFFFRCFCCLFCLLPLASPCRVLVGLDRVFEEERFIQLLQGKRIALITHSAAINQHGQEALELFHRSSICSLTTLCTLEHGYYGVSSVEGPKWNPCLSGVNAISLYGVATIPESIFEENDLLVYDVQDIGVRSYVFVISLLQLIQAAEQHHKPIVILDRPNPMGGLIVDGPLPASYDRQYGPEIPYCYGMTPGELALFYKAKYAPHAEVIVVPMQGWKRSMLFSDTGLNWIPTSPQIPESDSGIFYATTGIIGGLSIVSIGVGYTLPFKVFGAPWMDGYRVAQELNKIGLPGVRFQPFCYEPFFGKFKMEYCSGVLLLIEQPHSFLPMETQSAILGVLHHLYPEQVKQAFCALDKIPARQKLLDKGLGGKEYIAICRKERYITWPLRSLCAKGREKFLVSRKPYLFPEYND